MSNWYRIGLPVLLVIALLVAAVAVTALVIRGGPAPQVAYAAPSPNTQAYDQPGYLASGCSGMGAGVGFGGGCSGMSGRAAGYTGGMGQTTGYTGGASCH
jgi:hypothetical protein